MEQESIPRYHKRHGYRQQTTEDGEAHLHQEDMRINSCIVHAHPHSYLKAHKAGCNPTHAFPGVSPMEHNRTLEISADRFIPSGNRNQHKLGEDDKKYRKGEEGSLRAEGEGGFHHMVGQS